jgi:hypothetical protein
MRRSHCQYSISFGSLNQLSQDESKLGALVTMQTKRNRRKLRFVISIGFKLFCQRVLQFELILQHNIRQWTGMPKVGCSMTIFSVWPSDAPIFRACQEWDLNKIRYLLESGEASVYDVEDEIGGLLEVRGPKAEM